jgi:hypothetical protein
MQGSIVQANGLLEDEPPVTFITIYVVNLSVITRLPMSPSMVKDSAHARLTFVDEFFTSKIVKEISSVECRPAGGDTSLDARVVIEIERHSGLKQTLVANRWQLVNEHEGLRCTLDDLFWDKLSRIWLASDMR